MEISESRVTIHPLESTRYYRLNITLKRFLVEKQSRKIWICDIRFHFAWQLYTDAKYTAIPVGQFVYITAINVASPRCLKDTNLNSAFLSARRRGQEPWPHFLWRLHRPRIVCGNVTGLMGLLHIWQLFWPPPSLYTLRKIYVHFWYSPQELPQNNSYRLERFHFCYTNAMPKESLWRVICV